MEKTIPVKYIQKEKTLKKKEIIFPQVQNLENSIQIDDSIGKLEIEKIKLKQKLYPINSPKNNIEKNVTILSYSEEPNIDNSIMFIAAHSGTGKLAYFKNLNKLKKNDIIKLTFKNNNYIYQVKDIWEIKKTGTIDVEKENSTQLILTTCSPTKENYQLIINSIQIKKES
ncbi:MAG: sortase [Bacilli bacterium]|nr:sortase [Bacilli bacterium]